MVSGRILYVCVCIYIYMYIYIYIYISKVNSLWEIFIIILKQFNKNALNLFVTYVLSNGFLIFYLSAFYNRIKLKDEGRTSSSHG